MVNVYCNVHHDMHAHVLVVGGGPYTGAPALAGRAALRAGKTVFVRGMAQALGVDPREVHPVLAAKGIIVNALAIEEISRGSGGLGTVVAAHTSLAGGMIARNGSEAQKEAYLAPLNRGDDVGAFALSEPGAGSDVQIAWAAHVGGFLLGFLALDLFAIGAPLPARRRPRRPSYLRDLDDDDERRH